MRYDERGNFAPLNDRQRVRLGSLVAAVAVVFCLAVGVIGWQVGWWFKEQNVNRQVNIDNNNNGTQTAWRDEAQNAIADYALIDPANTAARGSLRNKACDLIGRLNDDFISPDLANFYTLECS
jgi:cytoskeletal protein RodZ